MYSVVVSWINISHAEQRRRVHGWLESAQPQDVVAQHQDDDDPGGGGGGGVSPRRCGDWGEPHAMGSGCQFQLYIHLKTIFLEFF